jgi:hypothetical protein
MGRGFTQQEDDGSAQVAVISYQMWQGRFHGDAGVWGRSFCWTASRTRLLA